MAEPTSSLENLADDALDNTDFGNKFLHDAFVLHPTATHASGLGMCVTK